MTVAPTRALHLRPRHRSSSTPSASGSSSRCCRGLLMELLDGSLSTAALYGGWLMFLFSALQFLSAPVLGNLSDHFGRRPVLLGSLGGLLRGLRRDGPRHDRRLAVPRPGAVRRVQRHVLRWLAPTWPTSRRRSSARAASGCMGAAWGLGFVVGPAIGGLLGDANPRLPFFVAAGLAAVNVVYGYFVLPESLAPANRRPFALKRANPIGAFRHAAVPAGAWACSAPCSSITVAHDANPATWTYVTMAKFDWTPRDIGLSMSFVGICAALVQGAGRGPGREAAR